MTLMLTMLLMANSSCSSTDYWPGNAFPPFLQQISSICMFISFLFIALQRDLFHQTRWRELQCNGRELDSSWISITLRRRWELVTTNVCQPTNRFLPRFDKGKPIDWVGEGSPKGRHRPNDHHKMPRKRNEEGRSDDLFWKRLKKSLESVQKRQC